MRFASLVVGLAVLCVSPAFAAGDDVAARVEALLGRMTLEEKIGQMCEVYSGSYPDEAAHAAAIRRGDVSSEIIFDSAWADGGTHRKIDTAFYRRLDRAAAESRLGIPLLNERNATHGHRTVLPILLAQAASFDPALVKEGAALVARELRADGVPWTFVPMLDVCRDPRWGRAAEGFGEEPFLVSEMGVALIRGLQENGVAACAKHFAGYGFCEGGRDYDSAEISPGTMQNVVLPPFRAAVLRGRVASVMTSFQDIGGTPPSASIPLLRGILRGKWGFDGIVVSDWGAVRQLVYHGAARDGRDAVRLAVKAGLDMEMVRELYPKFIPGLVASGELTMADIDDCVRHVLTTKFRQGLFDPPRAAAAPVDEAAARALARRMAAAGSVLAENDGLLPLGDVKGKRIVVIGPMARERLPLGGCWSLTAGAGVFPTFAEEIARAGRARGCEVVVPDSELWDIQLVRARRDADIVVCCVGEHHLATGEMHSLAHLRLPCGQDELIAAAVNTERPVVVVCASARPIPIPAAHGRAAAILYSWQAGEETAGAVADILFGAAEPGGRFPMTVPRHEGQIPIYNARKCPGKAMDCGHFRGPPLPSDTDAHYGYYDGEAFRPLYPFGYGLTWTTFGIVTQTLARASIPRGGTNALTVVVRNTGKRAGTAVAQCYLRLPRGGASHPMRQLVGFRKVPLQPGAEATVVFPLGPEEMCYFSDAGDPVLPSGEYLVAAGFDGTVVPILPFAVTSGGGKD